MSSASRFLGPSPKKAEPSRAEPSGAGQIWEIGNTGVHRVCAIWEGNQEHVWLHLHHIPSQGTIKGLFVRRSESDLFTSKRKLCPFSFISTVRKENTTSRDFAYFDKVVLCAGANIDGGRLLDCVSLRIRRAQHQQ